MASLATTFDRWRPGPRFELWVQERVRRRRGPLDLPLTLEYRHVYVMPTVFGAWFGGLLVMLLLGGLNFNNNMALLMGFLLGAIAQITTLLVYRNLVGLTVTTIAAEPVFAGEQARFRIYLKNPEPRHRFALQARMGDTADTCDIGPQETTHLVLRQPAPRRGWLDMPAFRLENRYPLGLFRAWSVMIPRTRCLVYPTPHPHPPPLPRTGRGDEGTAKAGEGDHFHGLREYRAGDPLRMIAWRASARHGRLFAREMETPQEQACELNWYLMGEGDTETRLSILTAWILRAERQQIPYALELPTDALPANLGDEHRDACLRILALHGHDGNDR
ncbi:DUF58 domain-containing protein [Elongatibacter sediminis]|uniref:DUF58 domain-containing protein n=1 Tax=Elongatibacter sediminis TaxID=3119006 RepID=A0AAW9RF38_9GAMM